MSKTAWKWTGGVSGMLAMLAFCDIFIGELSQTEPVFCGWGCLVAGIVGMFAAVCETTNVRDWNSNND